MSIPTLIVRHRKERLGKCSLEPLRNRPGLVFRRATKHFQLDATGFILLAVDAPLLTLDDGLWEESERTSMLTRLTETGFEGIEPRACKRPLLLPDATWRLLPGMLAKFHGEPIRRSLPVDIRTAYPRVSKIDQDPKSGLASVEALSLASRIWGVDEPTLLDGSHWREAFLEKLTLAWPS